MTGFLVTVPNGHAFGTVNITDSATQLDDVDCQMVMLQADEDNSGNVYYGGSSVTANTGIMLEAGDFSPWIPLKNLSDLYAIAGTSGDDLIYHCVL